MDEAKDVISQKENVAIERSIQRFAEVIICFEVQVIESVERDKKSVELSLVAHIHSPSTRTTLERSIHTH